MVDPPILNSWGVFQASDVTLLQRCVDQALLLGIFSTVAFAVGWRPPTELVPAFYAGQATLVVLVASVAMIFLAHREWGSACGSFAVKRLA